MTPDSFRRLALGLPGASEAEHMGHPDFRVNGRIFASLFGGPDGQERGMVKVSPDEQEALVAKHPDVFEPCAGAWGRQGCTAVHLKPARVAMMKGPMESAYRAAASSPRARG